jgi:hypothetical protein
MVEKIYFSSNEESLTDKKFEYVPVIIKPCPICGKNDALYIDQKDHYEKLYKENEGACLGMGCKRCDLTLTVYDHNEADPSYSYMRGALISKWNERKEATNES